MSSERDASRPSRLARLVSQVNAEARVVLQKAQEKFLPPELRNALRAMTSTPTISWTEVRHRLLQCPEVVSLSFEVDKETLCLTVEDENGRDFRTRIVVGNVFFAPRGAKEVHFRVEPPEHVRSAAIRECVGAMAEMIARKMWPFAVDRKRTSLPTLVEQSDNGFRVDLREVPAVSSFVRRADFGLLADAIIAKAIRFCENGIVIELTLPNVAKP